GQARLLAHQHLGLSEIQSLAGLGDLFDSLVVFENYPLPAAGAASSGAGGLRLSAISGQDATDYPLLLAALPGRRLELRLNYRGDLFAREWVAGVLDRLVRLLEGAVGDPARAIGRLDLLGSDERARLLGEFAGGAATGAPALRAGTLVSRFAAQAQATPDA